MIIFEPSFTRKEVESLNDKELLDYLNYCKEKLPKNIPTTKQSLENTISKLTTEGNSEDLTNKHKESFVAHRDQFIKKINQLEDVVNSLEEINKKTASNPALRKKRI